MVDRSLIVDRLEAIHENLARAVALAKISRDKFASTPEIHMLAERCLHLVLEALLDTANHIVSAKGLGAPQSYADSIEKLAENRLIPKTVAKKLLPWVGFRNLLVHGYLKLDHGRTHDAIKKDLAPIRQFVRIVSKYL